MSQTADELKAAWEQAEAHAVKLSNDYDAHRTKLRDEQKPTIDAAVDKAARAQKAYLDAAVIEELQRQPDGAALAESLGLKLPDTGN